MNTFIAASACPKWSQCSAPICPLDEKWQLRSMRDDESVCFYLLEVVKPNAEGEFQVRGLHDLFKVTSSLVQPISSRWGRVKRQIERAKTTGSRMTRVAPWEVGDGN